PHLTPPREERERERERTYSRPPTPARSSLAVMVSARPRDRILTTATALVRAEGSGAGGVNRIIGQADVAPMTLYRQFGGKDALVAATIEQWSIQWLHRVAEGMGRPGDQPRERFDGLLDELAAR